MTFDEAILEANAQGWYLYALNQEEPFHDYEEWHCCLRSLTGGYRRQISRGSGDDAISAICNALGAAPELEREVSLSDMSASYLDDRPVVDLRALILKPREKMRRV